MGGVLSDYSRTLDHLFARTAGAWKLGLDRTHALLAALGEPHRGYPIFHVAGTNGKGSAVATLDALLSARGLRVGRYTSPHLVDFRERVVVDGGPVAEADVVEFFERAMPLIERLDATFFEGTTAFAFDAFARAAVDVAVVEVGLGGRLDATNVVQPVAAGVTSIALEHTQYLGTTLEAIATEKGGIFKRGVPAVIGERDGRLSGLLAQQARATGAEPVSIAGVDWTVRDVVVEAAGTAFTFERGGHATRLRTGLVGRHQAANAAFALAMLHAAGGEYADAARHARVPLDGVRMAGRFQQQGRYLFDVAHNPAGAAVLADTLAAVSLPRPVVALVGVLGDKDWRGVLRALAPAVDAFVLTAPPSAPAERAWPLADAAAFASTLGLPVHAIGTLEPALQRADQLGQTTLVTGSFHTVGDVMLLLQPAPALR